MIFQKALSRLRVLFLIKLDIDNRLYCVKILSNIMGTVGKKR